MRSTWVRALTATTALVVVVLAIALWPTVLGGSTLYVTTHGSSMEPMFHQGDLALVRPASEYRVGDVVAYRNRDLGGVTTLHRIVAKDARGYTFKGDNNDDLDGAHPTDADLLGRLWHRVPHGGRLLRGLRVALPLLAGGIGLLSTGATVRRRRRRARPARLAPRPTTASSVRSWHAVTLGLAATAAACGVLGTIAYTKPTSTPGDGLVRYTQRGTFTYDGAGPAGPVYADGRVRTGDPVFRRLVRGVDVSFEYAVDTEAERVLAGTIAVRTQLSSSTGWHRVVDELPAVAFSGTTARATVHLDLDRLQTMVDEVEAATGVKPGMTHVAVLPEAKVVGTLDGRAVQQRFAPRFDFSLDPLQLKPSDLEKQRDVTEAASLRLDTARPRTLEAFGVGAPVDTVRLFAVGLGLPAILGAGAGLVALRQRLEDEADRIELRHGHRIVPVSAAGTKNVIEVTSMQDLARLAEQYQALILHRQGQRGHDYLLQADGVVYRYRAREGRPTRGALGINS